MMKDATPGWFSLSVIFLMAVVLIYKHCFMFMPPGPILWDEWLYKENAWLIFTGQHFFSAHYPPFYSVVLSIAFFFRNWYESMLGINALLSTLLVIPVWLIARMYLSRRWSLVVILLLLLRPFQVIYPGFLMSESLFLPLFAFCVYFALQGAGSSLWKAALFGAVLALAYLTRFLMLPAIPVLILFWILLPRLNGTALKSFYKSRKFLLNLLAVIGCFIIMMLPWILFAHHSHLGVMKALGKSYSAALSYRGTGGGIFSNGRDMGDLVMWAVSVALYIVLSAASSLALLGIFVPGALSGREARRKNMDLLLFIALLFTLAGLFWLLSAQHSFRAAYNYPVPIRLMGRYLLHLNPLFIVAGIAALSGIIHARVPVKKGTVLWVTVMMILIITAGRWILFRKGIWGIPASLAQNFLDSPGIMSYNLTLFYFMKLAQLILIGGAIWMLADKRFSNRPRIALLVLCLLILGQAMSYRDAIRRGKENTGGVHARTIAKVLRPGAFDYKNTPLIYSVRYLWPDYWVGMPAFWGIPQPKYIAKASDVQTGDTLKKFLYLTEDSLPVKSLISYNFAGVRCYLYDLDLARERYRPLIHEYGLNGKGKGTQKDPDLWFRVSKLSRTTVVMAGDKELKASVDYQGILHVSLKEPGNEVPPGTKIWLYDKFFGVSSDTVTLGKP